MNGATPTAPPSTGSRLPLLVLLGTLWGALFPISRLGIDAGANPFALVTVDFLLASGTAIVLAVVVRAARPRLASLAESAALGALMIGGINLPLFWGEQFATGGVASIVYATSPAISLLVLLAARRAPRPSGAHLAALAMGLAGVLVLSLAAGSGGPVTNPWGLAAFALGATCQGVGAVLIAVRRPHGEERWGQAAQFTGAAAAGLVTMGFLSAPFVLPVVAPVVLSIAYMGIVSLVVGYSLFFRLIREAGPVAANLVTFVNPVVALALGVFVFGESFRLAEGFGLVLVLVGLALLERPDRPPTPALPSAGGPIRTGS